MRKLNSLTKGSLDKDGRKKEGRKEGSSFEMLLPPYPSMVPFSLLFSSLLFVDRERSNQTRDDISLLLEAVERLQSVLFNLKL